MAASSEMDDIVLWGLLIKGDQKALEILFSSVELWFEMQYR